MFVDVMVWVIGVLYFIFVFSIVLELEDLNFFGGVCFCLLVWNIIVILDMLVFFLVFSIGVLFSSMFFKLFIGFLIGFLLMVLIIFSNCVDFRLFFVLCGVCFLLFFLFIFYVL